MGGGGGGVGVCKVFLLDIGDRPNTVSESTVLESTASNTNLVSYLALTEFLGENSASSFRPSICVSEQIHRVRCRTHRVRRKT